MATSKDIGASDWKKNKANYWALTPISFLQRTNKIWPEKIAWIHGSKNNTYNIEFINVNRKCNVQKMKENY